MGRRGQWSRIRTQANRLVESGQQDQGWDPYGRELRESEDASATIWSVASCLRDSGIQAEEYIVLVVVAVVVVTHPSTP